jgi:hypothetical protein
VDYANYWQKDASNAKLESAPKVPQAELRRKHSTPKHTNTQSEKKIGDVMEKLERSFSHDGTGISPPTLVPDQVSDDELYKRLTMINKELKKLGDQLLIKKFELGYVLDHLIMRNAGQEKNIIEKVSTNLKQSRSYLYQIRKFYTVVKDHQKLLFCNVPVRFIHQNLHLIQQALQIPKYSEYWKHHLPDWCSLSQQQPIQEASGKTIIFAASISKFSLLILNLISECLFLIVL